MRKSKTSLLIGMATELAAGNPQVQAVLGPGAGDRATHTFMRRLRENAVRRFGADYSEKKVCGQTALAVDFYFPDEKTIVEVALGLPNSATEFEKDVLKAIMAKETGNAVRRLVSYVGRVRRRSALNRDVELCKHGRNRSMALSSRYTISWRAACAQA